MMFRMTDLRNEVDADPAVSEIRAIPQAQCRLEISFAYRSKCAGDLRHQSAESSDVQRSHRRAGEPEVGLQ